MQITIISIIRLRDLLFGYDNVASYECFKHNGLHTNFLTWTALRTSVPHSLKARVLVDEFDPMVQNRIAKKISKGKMTSAEALTSLQWVILHARRFGHRCCLVQDAMKGEIPNILMCSNLP